MPERPDRTADVPEEDGWSKEMGTFERLMELETELESMTQEEFDARSAEKISRLDFSEDDRYKDDSELEILGLGGCPAVSACRGKIAGNPLR